MHRTHPRIIVHADDFGIAPAQSRRILACSSRCGGKGALNSLSALVTSPRFHECADLLRPYADDVLVGLHVNLVEGHCAADPRDVDLLVDGRGVFKKGFVGMLATSMLHPSKARRQISHEIGAQIDVFLDAFPNEREHFRMDSHQHFHMIPAVFDAMLVAAESRGCALEYLRIPVEPRKPFSSTGAWGGVTPINRVKRTVLNALWRFNRRKVPELRERAGVFCGIGFSGWMTEEHVGSVLEGFKELADQGGVPLELLFHPGGVETRDECLDSELAGFVDFYLSDGRSAEAAAVESLEAVLDSSDTDIAR